MSFAAGYLQTRRAALVEEFGGACAVYPCSETGRLEFAHLSATGIKGRGRGMSVRIQDVEANPEYYALMCRMCHNQFDKQGG